MLSNMDIKKQLKKGDIAIYPFKGNCIEEANICITAGKFAWSLDHKNEKGKTSAFLQKIKRTGIVLKFPQNNQPLFSRKKRFIYQKTLLVSAFQKLHCY